jgi:hypothetical protein
MCFTKNEKRKSMFKFTNFFIVLLILGMASTKLYAQEKFERESRLKRSDVPEKALCFIDSLEIKSRVKWYFEQGLERSSIEAKFKKDKKKHSVEFDSLGNIEDVEILIKWKKLPAQLKDSINFQFQTDCAKHKIEKVQIQFTGGCEALFAKIKTQEINLLLTTRYEIIVRCSSSNDINLFEYLFGEDGEVISRSKIIFKNSTNLEF